jgi:hypothetical protein
MPRFKSDKIPGLWVNESEANPTKTYKNYSETFWTENGAIYSYRHHFGHIRYVPEKILLINLSSPIESPTTAKHQSYACRAEGTKFLYEGDVICKLYYARNRDYINTVNPERLDLIELIPYYIFKAEEALKEAKRAHKWKKGRLDEAYGFLKEIDLLQRLANISLDYDIRFTSSFQAITQACDDYAPTVREKHEQVMIKEAIRAEKQREAYEAQREIREAERIEREKNDALEEEQRQLKILKAKEDLPAWLEGQEVNIELLPTQHLRINPKNPLTVETSTGYIVPLDQVKTLCRLYRLRDENTIFPSEVGGHTVRILPSSEGLKVGCHFFSVEEIDRFTLKIDLNL